MKNCWWSSSVCLGLARLPVHQKIKKLITKSSHPPKLPRLLTRNIKNKERWISFYLSAKKIHVYITLYHWMSIAWLMDMEKFRREYHFIIACQLHYLCIWKNDDKVATIHINSPDNTWLSIIWEFISIIIYNKQFIAKKKKIISKMIQRIN